MSGKNPSSACIVSIVAFSVVAVALLIAPAAVVRSDNAHQTQVLADSSVVMEQSSIVFRGPGIHDSGGALGSSAAVADLRGNGKADIVVVNQGVNGSLGVLLNNGNGTFQPAVVYNSANGDNSIAIGDLNGDRKPDLVVASQACPTLNAGCLGVFLGNGDGTFQPEAFYPDGYRGWEVVPGAVIPLTIADLNGDHKPDLVIVSQTDGNYGHGHVGVLLGNGDGTFKPVVTYVSGGFGAFSAALADVNGDGRPDVVVFNCVASGPSDCRSFNKSGIVGVLLGNGDGTFQPVRTYSSGGVAGFSLPIVVTDVNDDGRPDILTGNYCPNNNCSTHGSLGVLLGNGDGTFQSAVTYDPGSWGAVESIAVADFNGDGRLDAAVGPGIGVFLGNGDGTFQPVTIYPSGNSSQIFAIDINHDGKADLVGINSSAGNATNTAEILLGNGDGTFQKAQNYKLGGSQFTRATLDDINGDGKPDLVAVNWCCLQKIGYEEGTVGVLVNISKSETSATLSSTLNPSVYGQRVTWTAGVSTSGVIPPTGRVYFTSPGGSIGSATLNSSGVATLTRSYVNTNAYPLVAAYKGDVNNFPSMSPVLDQTVLQTTSSATIKSSVNPSAIGEAVIFTAKITSPTVTPSGSVTFTLGQTTLGTAQLSSGKATFTTSSLPAGSNVVKVSYNGNSNVKRSSASVTQVVQP